MDEPSSHLDRRAEEALGRRLRLLCRRKNILVVTHSRELLRQCDNIILFGDGRVVEAGSAEDMLAKLFPAEAAAGSGETAA